MIDDCRIIWHENESADYSGLDCEQYSQDLNHFRTYPHTVKYQYNSRGFRGAEWPTNLSRAIWCLGDSFTVGLGVPESHTWWHQLSVATGRPCVPVAMDGAANTWISRWASRIAHEIPSSDIVVQWSFTHRRERDLREVQDEIWQEFYNVIKDNSWPHCASWYNVDKLPLEAQQELRADPRFNCYTQGFDLESMRRLQYSKTTVEQDIEYTTEQIHSLERNKHTSQVIHSHIPNWHTKELKINSGIWIDEYKQVDLARDGLHYDIATAQQIVRNILKVFEI